MRKPVGILLSACLLILGAGTPAPALPLILDFTGGIALSPGADAILGWEFSVSSAIVIGQLAFWDEGGNGLAHSHDVGLWTLSETLLASTTITNASTPTGSTSPNGRWLFNSIAPVLLAPGSYVLGATFLDLDSDRTRLVAVASEIAGVTFVQARENTFQSTLAFPDLVSPGPNNDGYFGPNAGLAAAVPEPASLLFLGLGIVGLSVSHVWKRR